MGYTELRELRREAILDGVRNNVPFSEIADDLGIAKWVIVRDVKYMRKNRDSALFNAQTAAQKKIAKNKKTSQNLQNKNFVELAGITLQEKNFQNMVEYYKTEIIKVMNSENKKKTISELPNGVRKTLLKNGILKMNSREKITIDAQNLLK